MTIKCWTSVAFFLFFFKWENEWYMTGSGWWYGMVLVWNSRRPSFKTMILKITVRCSEKRVGPQSEVRLSIASAIFVCVCARSRVHAWVHACLLVPAGFYPAWTFTDCLSLYLFYLGQCLEETHKCIKQQASKLIVEALNKVWKTLNRVRLEEEERKKAYSIKNLNMHLTSGEKNAHTHPHPHTHPTHTHTHPTERGGRRKNTHLQAKIC